MIQVAAMDPTQPEWRSMSLQCVGLCSMVGRTSDYKAAKHREQAMELITKIQQKTLTIKLRVYGLISTT